MKELAKIIGQRIRSYRTQCGYSQEELAERAGCHSTYIGQLERGEKNATVENLYKVATALDVSLSELLSNLHTETPTQASIPQACYELLLSKTKAEQELLYRILLELDKYKAE